MAFDVGHALRSLLWLVGHSCVAWPLGRYFFDFEVIGGEYIPLRGGVLVASNHASYFDPPFLGNATPRVMYYVARAELFRHPLFGGLIRAWGAFPIGRNMWSAGGMKEALRKLRSGRLVLFFPEGTRSYDGEPLKPMAGAGFLVYNAYPAPIIPAHVEGSFQVLPRGAKSPRRAKVTVSFGPPIDFSRYQDGKGDREKYAALAGELMAAIAALRDALPVDRRVNAPRR
jgi:1-acyl-sn-glycerol-3-phosphate acyltransferase